MIRVGEVIHGRYEVQQRIGMGGMADVYKAMDRKLNRYVAIKVLKPEFSSDKSFVAKFQAEARAAAGLSHPNIVSVYDVAEENGAYFIVMEIIEGITLKQYIEKKGKLTIKEATSIAIQVATGIEAAHQNNIIHRDIKPQNIIISKDGKVKIADFGIAKAISANTNTISSNVMGSVHYSSPEQSRGGYLDAKSDIYSLGIVMFEMVTGSVPFDGDTTVAVAIQHLQENVPAPSSIVKEVPISLEKIILKCTSKTPANRYENAGLLIADLKQSLITPDEDFVELSDNNDISNTTILDNEAIKQIKGESNRVINMAEKAKAEDVLNDFRRPNNKHKKRKSDDYDDDINPKSEKIMGIITIVAAIAIIIVVIMIIIKIGKVTKPSSKASDTNVENSVEDSEETDSLDDTNSQSSDNSGEFKVPNVIGSTVDEAVKTLEEKGLIVIKNADPNTTGMPGRIISQKPIDTNVVSGDTVEITFVPEAQKVDLPTGLENMGEEEVTNTLKEIGFVVKPEFEYNNDIEAGKVVSTKPAGGTQLDKGGTVTLVISKGPEELKMPSLLGMKKKKALEEIKKLGLEVGTISENVSADYKTGTVMEQSIAKDAIYQKGDSVNITISLGVQDTQEDFVWMWAGTVSEPEDYTGSKVKIVLEQTDGANIKTKTIWENQPFDFDNHRFAEYALVPGVTEGKLYIYEKSGSGDYSLLTVNEVKFQMIHE